MEHDSSDMVPAPPGGRPRSRLDQAMSVAREVLEYPLPPWTPSHQLGATVRAADLDVDLELYRHAEGGVTAGSFVQAFESYTGIPAEIPVPVPAGVGGPGATATYRDPMQREPQLPRTRAPQPRPAPQTDPVAGVPSFPDLPDEELVVDLRPRQPGRGPAPRRPEDPDYGLGRDWGAAWKYSAQGWVGTESGNPSWRPIVTTTTEIPNWDVDTYLGVVVGEAAVRQAGDSRTLGDALAEGRAIAMDGLVDSALGRGAHAVVGVTIDYTPMGRRVVITATGTAVALRDR